MSDELKKQLDSAVQMLLNGLEKASNEVPIIIQEKLNYDWYYYFYFTLLWISLSVISALLARYTLKKVADWNSYSEGRAFLECLAYGAPVCMGIVTLAAIGNNVPILIQISVAPRLYILEWLRGML